MKAKSKEKPKAPKKEKPLKIKGTFEEVIRVAMGKPQKAN